MSSSAINDQSQHENFLEMDITDQTDKQFADFGHRIAKLIESPKAHSNHYFVATLDDFLGATAT